MAPSSKTPSHFSLSTDILPHELRRLSGHTLRFNRQDTGPVLPLAPNHSQYRVDNDYVLLTHGVHGNVPLDTDVRGLDRYSDAEIREPEGSRKLVSFRPLIAEHSLLDKEVTASYPILEPRATPRLAVQQRSPQMKHRLSIQGVIRPELQRPRFQRLERLQPFARGRQASFFQRCYIWPGMGCPLARFRVFAVARAASRY